VSSDDWNAASDVRPSGLDLPRSEHFKWVWNEAEGDLVWRVSGPGDGWPFHEEQVRKTWGRGPSAARGDVVGRATYTPAGVREHGHLSIYVHAADSIPLSIMRWFEDAFPDAEMR
jgi:hypothetical protein